MEFQVLGPLDVVGEDGPVALGGPKQRAVLAHLILRANRVVLADVLIDGLWGEDPPETARNTLQTYVYRLRKLVGEDRLEGRDGGYVLHASPEEIDAARFEAIVRQAKTLAASDPGAASSRFSDALALWRGSALADLGDEPSLRGEIARLEELRLSATEHRIAAEIAVGGHSTVVSELEALTADHPLRERMWANLMLALHRLGRQAEALSTFQRAREVLAAELGVEPSAELRRLHERILRGDPALARVEPPRTTVRPSRVDLPPGTEFAGYRIERTLGRGGMSVVYLAEHDWLQRKVALKVLAPQLAEDERFRERFVRESRLAASLDHPNVIPIYEAGASGGDLFIAMRYVEGTDLRTLLHEAGALEPAKALAIVRQVAAALDAAHEQGLVHRDVKPGNVLIARQRGSEAGEHVYLSDFGLTKRSASDSGVTGTGQFVGTLDYAAPEQFKGGTPDARTDVYSLGCVLFECLSGHPPFRSQNDAGLMYAHLQEAPPAVTCDRTDLPRAIDGVVAKAMAKAPPDRHRSAGELADEAGRALGHGAGAGGPAGAGARGRLRRLVPALAVALALAVAVVVTSLVRGGTQEAPLAAAPSETLRPSPTVEPNFRTVERALSEDERRLLTSIPEDVRGECLPLDRDEPIHGELATLACRTEDVEVLYEQFQADDAMDAVFQTNANIQRAPDGDCAIDREAVSPYTIDGEPAGRVLCYTLERGPFSSGLGGLPTLGQPDQSHLVWTDENTSIYAHAVRNDLGDLALYEWWLISAGPLTPGADAATAQKDRSGAAGPRLRDGTYLFASPEGCAGFRRETCALHIDGDGYELIFTLFPTDPAERGHLLLQKPDAVVFSPQTGFCFGGVVTGPARSPKPAAFEWSSRGGFFTFARTGGGKCAGPQKLSDPDEPWVRAPAGLIALEREGEITLMEPGGFDAEALAPDDLTRRKDPDWSTDGSRIVFASNDGTTDDLYVMNVDGTGLTRLTEDDGDEYQPAWSPDGSRIAFASDDLGFGPFSTSIVTVDPNGGGWTELATRSNERVGWPAWSPDGNRIAFSVFTGEGFELYVMDADGNDQRKLHAEPQGQFGMPVAWAPDGERIVFWGQVEGGRQGFLTIRPDGSEVRKLAVGLPYDGTLAPDWSPDERWIIAGPPFELAAQTGDAPPIFLIRADGSEIFVIAPSGSEPAWRPENP